MKQNESSNRKQLTILSSLCLVLTVVGEELLENFESSTNIFLRDFGQGVDLSEGSGDTALAAGNEDTSGNDCFLRLALESLCVINQFEEVLGCIGDILGDINSVAVGTDLLVGCEETLGSLIVGRLVLGSHEVTTARVAILEGDGGGELRSVEEGVCAIPNTRRIIIALVIVRKGTPLRSSVDDTITKDQSARTANHIARRKLFDEIRWNLLAVLADHGHVQVLAPFSSGGGLLRRGHHLGFVRLGPVDVVKFVKDQALAALATDLLSLARYDSTSLEVFGGFSAEDCSRKLDKEWGMRFGGVD